MSRICRIVEHLNSARARLEATAASVPAELWRHPPRPGAWSAAEVIAHLTMVEQTITDGATRRLCSAPPRVPVWKRIHLPVWLAGWRAIRAKTPIPLDPALVTEKEVMLGRLAELRVRTLALLEENRSRELGAYRWRHPIFGSLNFYDWFRLMAYHEARHRKQIRETVDFFQE